MDEIALSGLGLQANSQSQQRVSFHMCLKMYTKRCWSCLFP